MSIVQRASAQSRGTVAPWPNFGLVLAQALCKHDACVYGCTGTRMGVFCTIAEERICGDYTTKCHELTVMDIIGEMTACRDYLPRLTARQLDKLSEGASQSRLASKYGISKYTITDS